MDNIKIQHSIPASTDSLDIVSTNSSIGFPQEFDKILKESIIKTCNKLDFDANLISWNICGDRDFIPYNYPTSIELSQYGCVRDNKVYFSTSVYKEFNKNKNIDFIDDLVIQAITRCQTNKDINSEEFEEKYKENRLKFS